MTTTRDRKDAPALTEPGAEKPTARPARARGQLRTSAGQPGDHLLGRLKRPRRFHTTLIAWGIALIALLALGIAIVVAANAQGLTPLRQRTSDETIAADLSRIDALRAQLDAAPAADRWRVARAKALLEAARTEYLDDDRTGFDVAAFEAARGAADDVANGAKPVTNVDVPAGQVLAGSTKVRPDLWERLESMKESEGFECAAEPLARMEVQLLWAGNEQIDQGDCHTSPHLKEAERLASDAQSKLDACRPQEPVAVAPVTPTPAKPAPSAVVPVPVVPSPEELKIPRNVHFALDRSFISARSHQVISGIASILKKYPTITVRLEGHTDSRASAAYNLKLSQNRVNAVRAEMVKLGIEPGRITTAFKGEGDLKVTEDSKANFARNRRVEMVFVDSEGQDIKAEDQEEDLQLESEQAFKKARPDPDR